MKLKTKNKILLFLLITTISTYFFLNWKDYKIITHEKNEFSSVWVFEQSNHRCLSFIEPPSQISQGCMNLLDKKDPPFNYVKGLLTSLFINNDPKKILVIGLGVATTPKKLNILVPDAKIDIVEINPMIQDISDKYFNFKSDNKNEIFIEDGIKFIANAPDNSYDIIIIDAFESDYIPAGFLTNEFIKDVKRVASENGIIAMNTFTNSKFSELENSIFKNNFDQYYSLNMGGNRIILSRKGDFPSLPEITYNSNIWKFRFIEVGIDPDTLMPLFNNSLASDY